MASLQANLVNFFVARETDWHSVAIRHRIAVNSPLKERPILMTYGKGMRDVKLKQIVSKIARSSFSKFCRSCSTFYTYVRRNKPPKTREKFAHIGVNV